MGNIFRTDLKNLPPWVVAVRGMGLMNAIVIDPKGPITAWDLCLKLKEAGLLAKPTHGHIICLAPPLVINKSQLQESIQIILNTFHDAT